MAGIITIYSLEGLTLYKPLLLTCVSQVNQCKLGMKLLTVHEVWQYV